MAKDKNGNEINIGDYVVFGGTTAKVQQVVNGPEKDQGRVLISVDGAERLVDSKDVERA